MLKTLALIGLTMSIAFATAVYAKPSMAPHAAPASSADKVLVITAKTRRVNVFEYDTVLFKVGSTSFALVFDGNEVSYNLQTLAPPGVLTHKVEVYVVPNPRDHQQGIP